MPVSRFEGPLTGGHPNSLGNTGSVVDEVLAVGDKGFRDKCYTRIDELLAGGRTLFFVSHNERDLKRFCTRGLYLDKGALVLDAPITEVLALYNSQYGIKPA